LVTTGYDQWTRGIRLLNNIHLCRLAALTTLLTVIACSGSTEPDASASARSKAQASSGQTPAAPAVVTGQVVPGAIVSLEPLEGELPLPEGPVILDQYSRAFVPDLLFVRVGQVVEFRNSEDVDHNIRVLRNPTGTTVMDVSGSQNQVFKHTFDQPGTYDVSCESTPACAG
jgi:hypothetical protein